MVVVVVVSGTATVTVTVLRKLGGSRILGDMPFGRMLLIAGFWFWGSAGVALAAPNAPVALRFPALHLLRPSLLRPSPLVIQEAVLASEAGPGTPEAPKAVLDGFGLALIGALGGGVALSALTIRGFSSDRDLFAPSGGRTAFITSGAISALGVGGWGILRARNGPLVPRRRIATLVVFGATYVAIVGVAFVGVAMAASSE